MSHTVMSEDRECRILVVSASLDQARAAVKLIKAIVDDTSDLPASNSIPWTIKNRYYSADVHFHLVQYAHWDPQSALRVPAIIFVWTRGQPYAEQIFRLQNGLARFEPEVALAIALGHEPPHHDDPPEGPDSFLADHGFEYIDGERTRRAETITSASASASTSEEDADADDNDDVQGLGRVVDALSTIMWPTMVRSQRDNTSAGRGVLGGKRKNQLQPSLVDFDELLRVEEGEDGGEEAALAALLEADAAEQGVPLTRARRMQREMEALERWLVENEEMHEAEYARTIGIDDDDDEHDQGEEDNGERDVRQIHDDGDTPPSVPDIRPPSVRDRAASLSSTSHPTTTPPSTAALPYSHVTTQSSGFDDDFSAFISAPPAISIAGSATTATTTIATAPAATVATSVVVTSSGSIPPAPLHDAQAHAQTNPTQMLLLSSHTGGSFRSWRSATSGFDIGEDSGYEALDDRSSLNASLEHEHAFGDGVGVTPRIASMDQRFGERAAGLGDVPFDLTDMLSTLQTMREGVAGIEDEAERRAATARFASEFVFKRMGVDGDERED